MMKYIKTIMILSVVFAFYSINLQAQISTKIDVNAVVQGPEGEPIVGAIVSGDEGAVRAVTDAKGVFSIRVFPASMLSVSAIGYKTLIVSPEDGTITLEYDDEDSYEAKVAFRTVRKNELLGGVSVVNVAKNQEENYTTWALDGMQAYVGGFAGALWGMDGYLVLIDGVPRDDNNIMPTEIEQISFLKGVNAVALYGSSAAKGVILITSKRGEAFNQKINVRANTGIYVPKSYPEYLGSAEYMTLYNEALANDGLDPLYSAETIYNHASGNNPYRYPDVDYYSSDYLKKINNHHDVTAEISGGNERAQFYTNLSYYYQNSLLNFGEAKNDYVDRLSIRGNIDLKLNDFIKSKVDASATFYNSKAAHGNYWYQASVLRPNRFAPLIPISMLEDDDVNSWLQVENSSNLIDGKYLLGGTQQDMTNPFADIYAAGYNKYTSRQFQFDAAVDVDLNKVLEGLSFNTQFSIDYSTNYNQSYNNSYAVYAPNWNNYSGTDLISSLDKYGEDRRDGVQNLNSSWQRQTIAFSAQFNYNNTFEKVHNVSGILLANAYQQSVSTVYHKPSNANLGIQLGYNYQHKYYADFSGAIVHSAKLPSNNRTAFSPTATLAWRISEENFLKNSSAVDNLRLSVSGGVLNTDLDISDYYLYESVYTQTDGAWYGWRDNAVSTQTTDSRRGENKDLTFVKRKEISIGIDGSLFKRMLTFDISFFKNKMEGLITQASTEYPNYFLTYWPVTSFIPYINYNNDERIGLDFNLNFNKKAGQVDFTLGVAGTYFRTEASKRDEMYADSYQNRTGRPMDALFGLVNDGFFSDQNDIDNHASQSFGEVKPGDIKYVDQNGDGIIDDKDEVYLGRAGWYGSPFTAGIHLTAKWNNFTFFALGTAYTGAYSMKSSPYHWVYGDGKYSAIVRDRWTEATKETATYPRLTTLSGDNNFRSSDFWLYSTDRFNLSKIQISYDLPLNNSVIQSLGFYISGSNLLTIAKERETMELSIGGSPSSRFYNLGIKAAF